MFFKSPTVREQCERPNLVRPTSVRTDVRNISLRAFTQTENNYAIALTFKFA
jgi:hypothetical protein